MFLMLNGKQLLQLFFDVFLLVFLMISFVALLSLCVPFGYSLSLLMSIVNKFL